MSDYTREPNENWLQENQGETVLLQFPFGEYAVTVHDDEETEQLLQEYDERSSSISTSSETTNEHGAGGVPADD